MIEFYEHHPNVTIYKLNCRMDLIKYIEDIQEHYPECML